LGELTQFVPFELVDSVLEETGKVQQRLRDLPSRVGVYFVLALALFSDVGYAKVWSKLVAGLKGLEGLDVVAPSEKALRDLRRRVGVPPLKALFEVLAGFLAQPRTPGTRYRRWRTVAFDGCSSIKAPDGDRTRPWLGKIKHRLGWAGYPMVQLMTLVETSTRGMLGAVFGPTTDGEITYARRLLHLLNASMLVLADRGFDANDFIAALAATGAKFLIRAKSSRRLPVLARLSDGSYLSRIASLNVRVIEANITLTSEDGSVITGWYRLITTLTDHRLDPAPTLIRLYHERWEIESAYYALRHTLMGGQVLRSCDPVGIEQELWALLALYQVLRIAMVAATDSIPGSHADRASFTTALQTARDQVIAAAGILPSQDPHARIDLVGVIGAAVLADLLPERRPRFSARKVKSPISRYHTRPADDDRPLTSTTITEVAIAVHEPLTPDPSRRGRGAKRKPPRQAPTTHHVPKPRPAPELTPHRPDPKPGPARHVLALLATEPQRTWPAHEIEQTFQTGNLNSLRT
jgi:hypothetical protein